MDPQGWLLVRLAGKQDRKQTNSTNPRSSKTAKFATLKPETPKTLSDELRPVTANPST